MSTALEVAVARLVNRVQHWTPNRWAKPSARGAGTRADRVHALAQRLADAAADAEDRPRRPVPRLDNDLALPDQLRVLMADAADAGVDDEELTTLARMTAAAL